MVKPSNKLSVLLALGAIIGGLSCTWGKKDDEDYYGSLVLGTIIGTLFTLICIVVASLPLCCGILKPQAKIIAGVVIGIALFSIFIPFIASLPASSKAVDDFCDRCEKDPTQTSCTEEDRKHATDVVSAFGVIIAYTLGFGFVTVILGITATILGCCICCKCCKMKDDDAAGGAPPVVIGQVAAS